MEKKESRVSLRIALWSIPLKMAITLEMGSVGSIPALPTITCNCNRDLEEIHGAGPGEMA